MTASASVEARSFIAGMIGRETPVTRVPEPTIAAMLAIVAGELAAQPEASRLLVCGHAAMLAHALTPEPAGPTNVVAITTDAWGGADTSRNVIVVDAGHPIAGLGAAVLVSPTLLAAVAWWRDAGDEPESGPGVPTFESTWAVDAESVGAIIALLRAIAGGDARIAREIDALQAGVAEALPDPVRVSRVLQELVKRIGSVQAANLARLEAVGHVATWIAHTVNNALTPILLAAEMGAAERDPEAVADLFEIISDSARRGGRVTHQLLAASPAGAGEATVSSLTAAARASIDAARADWPDNVALLDQLPEEPLPVALSALQAEFVLGALIQAARMLARAGDAVPVVARRGSDGTAELEVSCTGARLAVASFGKRLQAGTTSPFTEAEGLGLALTRLIVESMGGSTAISAPDGAGTTFRVSMPLVE